MINSFIKYPVWRLRLRLRLRWSYLLCCSFISFSIKIKLFQWYLWVFHHTECVNRGTFVRMEAGVSLLMEEAGWSARTTWTPQCRTQFAWRRRTSTITTIFVIIIFLVLENEARLASKLSKEANWRRFTPFEIKIETIRDNYLANSRVHSSVNLLFARNFPFDFLNSELHQHFRGREKVKTYFLLFQYVTWFRSLIQGPSQFKSE